MPAPAKKTAQPSHQSKWSLKSVVSANNTNAAQMRTAAQDTELTRSRRHFSSQPFLFSPSFSSFSRLFSSLFSSLYLWGLSGFSDMGPPFQQKLKVRRWTDAR